MEILPSYRGIIIAPSLKLTNMHLKLDGCEMKFPKLGYPIFRCELLVSRRVIFRQQSFPDRRYQSLLYLEKLR